MSKSESETAWNRRRVDPPTCCFRSLWKLRRNETARQVGLRIATARQVSECYNLWETAKAETTLGNARHAGKRRSASRSPRTSRRRRRNNAARQKTGSRLNSKRVDSLASPAHSLSPLRFCNLCRSTSVGSIDSPSPESSPVRVVHLCYGFPARSIREHDIRPSN